MLLSPAGSTSIVNVAAGISDTTTRPILLFPAGSGTLWAIIVASTLAATPFAVVVAVPVVLNVLGSNGASKLVILKLAAAAPELKRYAFLNPFGLPNKLSPKESITKS